MADHIARFRSNYFRVNNPDDFEAFCRRYNLTPVISTTTPDHWGFIGDGENGMPSTGWDQAQEDWIDVDFLQELATHLQDKHVAIMQEIGYENMHYLSGHAWAVNHQGEIKDCSLEYIYTLADTLGSHITNCAY